MMTGKLGGGFYRHPPRCGVDEVPPRGSSEGPLGGGTLPFGGPSALPGARGSASGAGERGGWARPSSKSEPYGGGPCPRIHPRGPLVDPLMGTQVCWRASDPRLRGWSWDPAPTGPHFTRLLSVGFQCSLMRSLGPSQWEPGGDAELCQHGLVQQAAGSRCLVGDADPALQGHFEGLFGCA